MDPWGAIRTVVAICQISNKKIAELRQPKIKRTCQMLILLIVMTLTERNTSEPLGQCLITQTLTSFSIEVAYN
jgi:hypothetical protein